jgi:hypothetical protein
MGQAESDPGNAARTAAFQQALAPLGWIDGRNIRIEYRWGAGDPGRLQVAAQALAALKPDIFVSESDAGARHRPQAVHALGSLFRQPCHLLPHQVAIDAFALHQHLRRTVFAHLACLQHDDPIKIAQA